MKKIAFSTFPLQTRFFHLGGGGRRVVLIYIDFTFLLVCLSVLNWSLCLTHGRHVSLQVEKDGRSGCYVDGNSLKVISLFFGVR